MLRWLQGRADDLAERLLISELEMRRSRTLDKKLEAYRDFGMVVNQIDTLRRDAEELFHWNGKDSILANLDRKVASVMRTPAFRMAEWFHRYSDVRWYVADVTVGV